MSKFRGKIGFATTSETRPGIWEERIIEKTYSGDLLRNVRRNQSSGNLNDNIVISNEISIIADPFINQNVSVIRYVEWMGAKWKVSSVDTQRPRLILTLGEVYNG